MLVSFPLFAPVALALEPISLDVQIGRPSHGVVVGIVAPLRSWRTRPGSACSTRTVSRS